jgi:hypothetical protein
MTILYNQNTKQLSKFYENGYNLPIREPYMHELDVVDVKPTIVENQWQTSEWVVDLEKKQYVRVYTVHTKTAYQLACEEWNSEFDFKVIVPADWLEDPQFYGVSSWAVHNKDKMEIRVIGESAHVYFNVLKDNHKTMLTSLGLTPMPKPNEKDYD